MDWFFDPIKRSTYPLCQGEPVPNTHRSDAVLWRDNGQNPQRIFYPSCRKAMGEKALRGEGLDKLHPGGPAVAGCASAQTRELM
jgi:hypothetical protein